MRFASALALTFALSITLADQALSWGRDGHRYINGNAVNSLPQAMSLLAAHRPFLEQHASDADDRKSADPTEGPKHFIDVENYPGLMNLPPDINAIVQAYGATYVHDNGMLPWATAIAVDSLTAQIRRGDTTKAWQTAADIGHYVGDGHQPLHCTRNFNGPNTTTTGIHSRYETDMLYKSGVCRYLDSLRTTPGTLVYVSDPFVYVKNYAIRHNLLADSILNADAVASAATGKVYNSTYYALLWQMTGRLTNQMMQEATVTLASLWYTAWVDAGLVPLDVAASQTPRVAQFKLEQNYPNPFNPATTVSGTLPAAERVRISVFDLMGREVALLLDAVRPAGRYEVRFDGSRLPSGFYVCRVEAGGKSLSRKMLLVK